MKITKLLIIFIFLSFGFFFSSLSATPSYGASCPQNCQDGQDCKSCPAPNVVCGDEACSENCFTTCQTDPDLANRGGCRTITSNRPYRGFESGDDYCASLTPSCPEGSEPNGPVSCNEGESRCESDCRISLTKPRIPLPISVDISCVGTNPRVEISWNKVNADKYGVSVYRGSTRVGSLAENLGPDVTSIIDSNFIENGVATKYWIYGTNAAGSTGEFSPEALVSCGGTGGCTIPGEMPVLKCVSGSCARRCGTSADISCRDKSAGSSCTVGGTCPGGQGDVLKCVNSSCRQMCGIADDSTCSGKNPGSSCTPPTICPDGESRVIKCVEGTCRMVCASAPDSSCSGKSPGTSCGGGVCPPGEGDVLKCINNSCRQICGKEDDSTCSGKSPGSSCTPPPTCPNGESKVLKCIDGTCRIVCAESPDSSCNGKSNGASCVIDDDDLQPPKDSDLVFNCAPKTATIKWDKSPTFGVESYQIERRVDGSSWQTFTEVDGNRDNKTDESVEVGKTYQYRVRARKSSENSAFDEGPVKRMTCPVDPCRDSEKRNKLFCEDGSCRERRVCPTQGGDPACNGKGAGDTCSEDPNPGPFNISRIPRAVCSRSGSSWTSRVEVTITRSEGAANYEIFRQRGGEEEFGKIATVNQFSSGSYTYNDDGQTDYDVSFRYAAEAISSTGKRTTASYAVSPPGGNTTESVTPLDCRPPGRWTLTAENICTEPNPRFRVDFDTSQYANRYEINRGRIASLTNGIPNYTDFITRAGPPTSIFTSGKPPYIDPTDSLFSSAPAILYNHYYGYYGRASNTNTGDYIFANVSQINSQGDPGGAWRGSTTLWCDRTAPVPVLGTFSKCYTPTDWTASTFQPIKVTVTDAGSGVRSVKFKISRESVSPFPPREINTTKLSGDIQNGIWSATIPRTILDTMGGTGKRYILEAIAEDFANNTSTPVNIQSKVDFSYLDACTPFVSTQGGDVHSNQNIDIKGGP